MTSKKKIAEVSDTYKTSRTRILEEGLDSDAPGPERLDFSDWRAVISELQEKEFQSFDQAVDQVIAIMLQRMKLSRHEQHEVEVFLKDLFEMDPIAAADLRHSLKIKS